MGQMRSPRQSVDSEQRGGPGTGEYFIAVEWMSLQTQPRSRRKNRTVLRHQSQDKRVFLEGRRGQQHQLHRENDQKKPQKQSVEFGLMEVMSDLTERCTMKCQKAVWDRLGGGRQRVQTATQRSPAISSEDDGFERMRGGGHLVSSVSA